MSLTNKIVANIKKTDADVRSFVNTTNVVCIDTSNNRIGINTKNPRYSIDILGIGPTNLIYVNKLEVGNSASIRDISCLNNIDASSATIKNINYTNISGNLITTKNINTISAEIFDLSISKLALKDFSAVNIDASYLRVSNSVDVCGNMIIRNLTVTGLFSGGNSTSFTTLEISNSILTIINSTNSFIRNIDCSTIKVDTSANFNGDVFCRRNINISGGSFQTLSGNFLNSANIRALTISCEQLVTQDCSINGSLSVSNIIDLNGRPIIQNGGIVTSQETISTFGNITVSSKLDIRNNCDISNLRITNRLDFSNNASLILPNYSSNNSLRNVRSLAVDIERPNFNIIKIYNSNSSWSNMYTKNHYAYLDLNREISGNTVGSITVSSVVNYFIENSNNLIYNNNNNIYKYIPLQFKLIDSKPANSNIGSGNNIFDILEISSNKLKGKLTVPDLSGIYEINATVSMKYLNRIPGDVEPNNYSFGLYNSNRDISYVENINNILTFDNSFNYSSLSLNYIGPLFNNSNGFIFLISSAKDINYLVIDRFNGSIKLLNY
jgi:cytoskeletal protein CcmA (bactofilin family)